MFFVFNSYLFNYSEITQYEPESISLIENDLVVYHYAAGSKTTLLNERPIINRKQINCYDYDDKLYLKDWCQYELYD